MAVIFAETATSLATASGFYRVEAYNLGMFSLTALTLSSTRNIPLTFANAGNCRGVVLSLVGGGTSGTTVANYRSVKVDLKEGATVRATVTLSASDIMAGRTLAMGLGYVVPFLFGTPYAVTTAAGTWSLDVVSVGAQSSHFSTRTSNGTAPFYAAWCDNAMSFTTGDCVIMGAPVTNDYVGTAKFTGLTSTGDTTNAVCGIVCRSSSPATLAGANSNFQWDGSASRTLQLDGMLINSSGSGIQFGSSASRITFANMGTLELLNRTVGTTASGIYDAAGATGASVAKPSIWIYGQAPTVQSCTLNADSTVGSFTFTTTTDVSSWQAGWRVHIGKSLTKGVSNATVHTIASVSAPVGGVYTVTLNEALAGSTRKSGGIAFVYDGYGFKVLSNTTNRGVFYQRGPSNIVFDGVLFEEFGGMIGNYSSTASYDDAANRSQFQLVNCAGYTTSPTAVINSVTVPTDGMLVENFYGFRCGHISTAPFLSGVSGVNTIQNTYVSSLTTGGPANVGTRAVFQNNTLDNCTWQSLFNGTGITWKNNTYWGGSAPAATGMVALGTSSAVEFTEISGNKFDNCTCAISFGTGISNKLSDLNSLFGTEVANTSDFGFNADTLAQYNLNSPTLTNGFVPNKATLITTSNGTWIRVATYDDTANDYRAWYTNGRFENSSESLLMYPYSGTDELITRYKIGSASISTFKLGVFTTVNIANTAYDAGTYILPKMVLNYDGGTETETQAAASFGSAQSLSRIVTPSVDNVDLYISLKAASDATESDNLVTWTSPSVRLRKYGYTFSDQTLTIKETTDDRLFTIATPASNPFTTEATAATVAAYTEFSIDHTTRTITISADTTLVRLYDYAQHDLTLDANMQYAEWFTTIDGTNYECDYDIVSNTGVDLTGGGSITMATGKTFTRTGTATYDGIIIDDTGRSVLVILNGLVSGSVVQIYNTTNSAEIDKSTVSGTQYRLRYLWTADKNIRVRVRYVSGTTGYLPYEATGTIANTGFSLNVSQESATVYDSNNIDGSTVSECSIAEGVILVSVDDPDNSTTFQRIYNFYLWQISQSTHIDDQPDYIIASSTRDYIFDDTLAIKNLDLSNPLYISGANVRNTSGTNALIDATGGSIFIRGDYPAASTGEIANAVTGHNKTLTVGKYFLLKQ